MKNTSHGLINMAKKCVKYQGHSGLIFILIHIHTKYKSTES